MSQPTWNTPSGNLVFPYTLSASAVSPATTVTYSVVSGSLPSGLSMNSSGVISGIAAIVYVNTTSTFTVRATDDLGNYRDRTFNIIIAAIGPPTFTLASGSNLFVTDDSLWVEYTVPVTNPDPSATIVVSLISGNLPSGLEINSSGLIRGYAGVVVSSTTYSITLKVSSKSGSSTATYSVIITPNSSPIPVILNTTPLSFTGNDNDIYRGYYVDGTQSIVTGSIGTISTSSFNGSISGDVLTITSVVSGTPSVGQLISGTNVKNGTFITEIDIPAASYSIKQINSSAVDFIIELTSVPDNWVVGSQITIENAAPVTYNGTWTINSVVSATEFRVVSGINPGLTTNGGIARSYGSNIVGLYKVSINQTAASTLISGHNTQLSVTSVTDGKLKVGQSIFGTGVSTNTSIVAYNTGSGGVGTYYVDVPQTVASTTITTSVNIGTRFFDDYFTFKVIGYDLPNTQYINGATYQIQSITSTAVDFTVTLVSVPSSWIVGTIVYIAGTTPALYNGTWTISSITGTTVTITSGINPGVSTVNGTIRANGYYTTALPPGLSMDPVTGWITGNPVQPAGISSQTYNFDVYVTDDNLVNSSVTNFSIKFTDNINDSIRWITQSDLGTINNTDISSLYVEATSNSTLKYKVISGSLPPNLDLSPDGYIYGRVAYQPSTVTLPLGTTTPFSFTVEAYDPLNPLIITDTRDFTVNVFQKYDQVIETVYINASPPLEDRNQLQTLLSNSVIPDSYVYRIDDPYYGRATSVKYQHLFGVYSSDIDSYISTLTENFYQRNITLGELKTAVAKDSTGQIIYEVVYSSVIDDLNNSKGVSISKEINWPYPINTALTNNITIQKLYPNSLQNMRTQISNILGREQNTNILPLWMTSQQQNGSTLGYTPAWVICYTKPGFSNTVKNNIDTLWNYKTNRINFTIDRFFVDKGATFNYSSGAWTNLPSGKIPTITIIETVPSGNIINEILASPATASNTLAYWNIGMPIKFIGTPFGGILNNAVYYVKSIDLTNNTFTISDSQNTQNTLLFSALGSMTAVPVYANPTPISGRFEEVLIQQKTIIG